MWEYKIFSTSPEFDTWRKISDHLDGLGLEGWELVNVVAHHYPILETTPMIHYLKRWTAADDD